MNPKGFLQITKPRVVIQSNLDSYRPAQSHCQMQFFLKLDIGKSKKFAVCLFLEVDILWSAVLSIFDQNSLHYAFKF